MGMGFSKIFGSDKPLIKVRCVFINRSNDVVVGEDGVDAGDDCISCEEEDNTDYKTVGCIQWRRKGKTKTTVMENENIES
jgi:hypothetical protein